MALTKFDVGTHLRSDYLDKQCRLNAALDWPVFAEKELCRRSFRYFLEYYWSEVSQDEFLGNWHIDLMCDELQHIAQCVYKKYTRKYDLVINVPPGTTKSITCSIMFPVWVWTWWHSARFITASYSSTLSLEAAEYSRELIRSKKFREMYPELEIKSDKDTKGNYRIVKTEASGNMFLGGNRFSTSVGATLTGFHGHFLLVDDPLNPTQAASEKELDIANFWMTNTLSTRKTDKRVSTTVLVMQRLHQIDPTGDALDHRAEEIKHISLPGEIREFKDALKPPELISYYKDDLLDPVRMPWEVLYSMKKTLGQYGYSGQVGQVPVPPGGGMFKVDKFVFIDSAASLLKPYLIRGCIRYWDKAGTEGVDKGAATAGVKMYKVETGIRQHAFVITDVKRGWWAAEQREKVIRSTAEADGQECVIYHEQEPGSGGKDSASATTRNLSGYTAIADRPTGDKVSRADPYSVAVNEGVVYLLRGEWNKDFTEEHRFFPFSKYKDQVDAASGAFTKLTALQEAGVW